MSQDLESHKSDDTIDGASDPTQTRVEVHYYWRPGCPFCWRLRRRLDKAGIETIDHNIWEEPGAADVVRVWANGSETVPTVVVGDVGLVNPSLRAVKKAIEAAGRI